MYANRRLKMMGTVIDIAIYSHQAERQIDEVIEQLTVLKNRFSANDDDSELMAINHSAGISSISVQPDLYHLIAIGKEHSLEKPSNLNIALGPVVQAWRIGFSDARVPSEDEITQALALSDPRDIILDEKEHSVFLAKKGMKIDLGGIAKGYTSTKIMDIYKNCGVTSGLVNLGGNVQVLGTKTDGSAWRIGIQDPQNSESYLGALSVADKAVITSGGYERYFEQDGKTYHHIIDPTTGYPAENGLISVTIVSADGTLADGLSASLFIMGKDKAIAYWQAHSDEFDMILMDDVRGIYVSEGIADDFTSDLDYEVVKK